MTEQDGTVRRVLRWEVPVDDNWHTIGGGPVVMTGCRPVLPGVATPRVEVWTEEILSGDWSGAKPLTPARQAAVFGTGRVLDPEASEHLGSVLDAALNGALVWHIYARGARR